MSPSRGGQSSQTGWTDEVLRFWFAELPREQWFAGGAALDEQIRSRFRDLHRMVAATPDDALLSDTRTALAAVIVLDQFSRNMFRGSPSAFENDAKALTIAEAALAKGFDGGLTRDERLILYLPFEHHEDVDAQARCVELFCALGDPELTKYAQAHKDIIDRFGRFPHRNVILGRRSTAEELEFLKGPGSAF
jgi:uncharacterized protein (DUF924 family)